MTESALPANVYRVAQQQFGAIPGAPWVHWAPEGIRRVFETLPGLGEMAHPVVGLRSSNNCRFLRYWWEVGRERIGFGCRDRNDARAGGKKWFPYMKGGAYRTWYGNQEHVVNFGGDGQEVAEAIVHAYPYLGRPWIGGLDYYFREGVTWSDLSSKGFGVRYLPPGFIFDVKGSSGFPRTELISTVLALMNSPWMAYCLELLNPTVSFQVGDISRVPFKEPVASERDHLEASTQSAVWIRLGEALIDETTFDFIAPPGWDSGLDGLAAAQTLLVGLEQQIDDEVYELYGISHADRAAIEAELAGGSFADDEGDDAAPAEEDGEQAVVQAPITQEELAVRWINYAVGIVLGRFQPGIPSALGSAVYHRADFAVGSLPEPDEAEFDQLIGPAERFAYVGDDGGRHLFPSEVEKELRELAVPDGIALFDEAHPRDLPALVERALTLMLGEASAQEVIAHGAGSDPSTALTANLRKFLERDFFTKWHFKWYRKRPVYWTLQSPRRSYGFVLFHERVERGTLYVLQREYLDHKLNGLRLQIGDLRAQLKGKEGRELKQVERQIESVTQILDELTQFAGTMDRLVSEGYDPEPDWIDDGIILRLAPLWELIPTWKSEPKKHWERLQRGHFDWSHIAMHYWPERIREKCKSNKSLAIAHGL